ncbi:MAG: hypothetical protein KJ051_04170 [Thermoleophilia bacterium]|nr:hypothetical protein [Thermoleophilia bacterium]
MRNWTEQDRDRLERELDDELKTRGLTRRDLIKGGMGMATLLGLGALFAACGGDGGDRESGSAARAPTGTRSSQGRARSGS